MTWGAPKWGREDSFSADPDLADILGRMDLDFDFFLIFWIFCNPDFWTSRSPDLEIPRFLDFQVHTLPFPVCRGPFTNLPLCTCYWLNLWPAPFHTPHVFDFFLFQQSQQVSSLSHTTWLEKKALYLKSANQHRFTHHMCLNFSFFTVKSASQQLFTQHIVLKI